MQHGPGWGLSRAQDDVVHAALSVEENLLFSARYRLPAGTPHLQHLLHVQRALQVPSACRCHKRWHAQTPQLQHRVVGFFCCLHSYHIRPRSSMTHMVASGPANQMPGPKCCCASQCEGRKFWWMQGVHNYTHQACFWLPCACCNAGMLGQRAGHAAGTCLRQVLGLEGVRSDLVGSPGQRAGSHGISGGQRKRVNIGLELVRSCSQKHLMLTRPCPCGTLESALSRQAWEEARGRRGTRPQHAHAWYNCMASDGTSCKGVAMRCWRRSPTLCCCSWTSRRAAWTPRHAAPSSTRCSTCAPDIDLCKPSPGARSARCPPPSVRIPVKSWSSSACLLQSEA